MVDTSSPIAAFENTNIKRIWLYMEQARIERLTKCQIDYNILVVKVRIKIAGIIWKIGRRRTL